MLVMVAYDKESRGPCILNVKDLPYPKPQGQILTHGPILLISTSAQVTVA